MQCQSFLIGLQKVIPLSYLQMFNEYELQMVLSGTFQPLDIEDLKKHIYYRGYNATDSYIKDFWKIISDMNSEDKKLFIKFVTSCERPPLLGFGNLDPLFTIQKIDSEYDKKLPTANTCFNKFNLPKYSSNKIMKEKIYYAIKTGMGFYLT